MGKIIIGLIILSIVILAGCTSKDDTELKDKFTDAIIRYHHDWNSSHLSVNDFSFVTENIYTVYYNINGTSYEAGIQLEPLGVTYSKVI